MKSFCRFNSFSKVWAVVLHSCLCTYIEPMVASASVANACVHFILRFYKVPRMVYGV